MTVTIYTRYNSMPSCQVPGNAKFSFHPIDVDTGHNIHQTGVNSNCNNNNYYPCPSPTPGLHAFKSVLVFNPKASCLQICHLSYVVGVVSSEVDLLLE